MDRHRHEVEIENTVGRVANLKSELSNSGAFARGKLRVTGGPLSGIKRHILFAQGYELHLDVPFPRQTVGFRATISEGCDQKLSTCLGRFNNARAFRGEPNLPGNDALIRYDEA